jgi:hypothetical protein
MLIADPVHGGVHAMVPSFWMMAGAVVFSLATTLGILRYIAVRWLAKPNSRTVAMEQELAPAIHGQNTAVDMSHEIEQSPEQDWEQLAREENESMIDDSGSILFARKMSRGRGEIDLARRLESVDGTTRDLRGMLGGLTEHGSTGSQRIKTAKRLGIGRGEVDLALRLRDFQQRSGLKEDSND